MENVHLIKMLRGTAAIPLVLALVSCGGSDGPSRPDDDRVVEFQFDGNSGWEAGFSDFPVGEEELFELRAEFEALPAPLEDQFGLNVVGANRSDDLFMFVKRPFGGFEPHAQYDLQFEITFATNAPSNCAGIGGAPGESVYVKAGATPTEPTAENDGTDFYRMNIDKGNQSIGGSDAIVIGDFANSRDCEDEDFSYELKTLTSDENAFSTFADSEGVLWVLFGTDSGFEGTTSIYYLEGRVTASPL